MKKTFLLITTAILSAVLLHSCDKKNNSDNTDCIGVAPSFSADVNPIIQTFCNQPGCHNSSSTNDPGPLTTYAEIKAASSRIRVQVKDGLMPQNATLTTAQKQAIICWINNGAPNN